MEDVDDLSLERFFVGLGCCWCLGLYWKVSFVTLCAMSVMGAGGVAIRGVFCRLEPRSREKRLVLKSGDVPISLDIRF